MPPAPSKISPAQLLEFMESLEPGRYNMDITVIYEVQLVHEGSTYFQVGNNVVTIWDKEQ